MTDNSAEIWDGGQKWVKLTVPKHSAGYIISKRLSHTDSLRRFAQGLSKVLLLEFDTYMPMLPFWPDCREIPSGLSEKNSSKNREKLSLVWGHF